MYRPVWQSRRQRRKAIKTLIIIGVVCLAICLIVLGVLSSRVKGQQNRAQALVEQRVKANGFFYNVRYEWTKFRTGTELSCVGYIDKYPFPVIRGTVIFEKPWSDGELVTLEIMNKDALHSDTITIYQFGE